MNEQHPARRQRHGQRPTEPLTGWPEDFGADSARAAEAAQPASTDDFMVYGRAGNRRVDLEAKLRDALAATSGEAQTAELAKLKELASDWPQKWWYGTFQITDGIATDEAVNFIAACSPAVVLDLIARIERTEAPKRPMSPEIKAAIEEAHKTGATSAIASTGELLFINYGHDLGDNAHLECTACGGSGHIEDQKLIAASGATASGDDLNGGMHDSIFVKVWGDAGGGDAGRRALANYAFNLGQKAASAASGDERAAFEAWALRERVAYRDEQHGLCWYNTGSGAHQWIGWQARAAVSAATKPTREKQLEAVAHAAAMDMVRIHEALGLPADEPVDAERIIAHLAATKPTAGLFTVEQVQAMIAADRAQIAATKPAAPAVPEEFPLPSSGMRNKYQTGYATGWNACRTAMLAAAPAAPMALEQAKAEPVAYLTRDRRQLIFADTHRELFGNPTGLIALYEGAAPMASADAVIEARERAFTAGWNDALGTARAEIRSMQDNLETFGPYSQETARVALDGALDAIDELRTPAAGAEGAE